jgi:hypothetical protein
MWDVLHKFDITIGRFLDHHGVFGLGNMQNVYRKVKFKIPVMTS